LVQLATRELSTLGLAALEDVEDGVVFRHAHAYPVYDPDYRARLGVIQGFLATIDNLQTIGRNGMHRYNNQDHSMLTGMLAVENMLGNSYDLWGVNEEEEYLEEAR
jgi:protoporphyrinogen oxidase